MNVVFLLLGANLGSPLKQLELAQKLLVENVGVLQSESAVYESEAWGVEEQPKFLNKVISLLTRFDPHETLAICQNVEDTLGRVRKEKWGARIIDIDILYYNSEVLNEPFLKIPHPYLHLRKFTMVPLVEIAPQEVHPLLKHTNEELLRLCIDPLQVIKIK
ncbi:2-amino-4-hydroxy-6-hydroxymethyldihydropteridine diphosphokinase [Sphingobacterium alkalisoli]|uniref:2-amino-4-hydroxy-6-hydroxymethyldihydropteridine pyrophosphokinase n=1 Tax=Sphingobacterium alkalisoli TaxID=1874115 RepID=A0A4U0H542_9SPHI|nr:2-amino-4-hydroxy-6-hydroxymethyldihydropteridine diphosphokinase [Sphingobacterium alkalisoli]TJY66810.1 2-amino-4-hydroxy-6-hydroxymethyldihydropteridine diphosphokinase [Sphingobacterium alkalisoli]GGH14070.1 2-amino-4-hydroxy-6-hydroxymethyldihydropteridine diphosphokinase [Sphingobacterium alkalisoli]